MKRKLTVLGSASDRADKTEIGWTHADGYDGRTWNPVTGCVKVSPGCKHCYAETFAERFRGVVDAKGKPHHFSNGFDPMLRPQRIAEPRRWRKPSMIFVNSMSDLFADFVPDSYLNEVFAVMRDTPEHIYEILTKRADRLVKYTKNNPWLAEANNIWLGVSVEDRKYGLPRVELLREATAAVRFLSIEPLLEAIGTFDLTGIDWVIVGGESGAKARAMHPDWAREVRDQCVTANVPLFFKQWGEFDAHGVRRKKKHSGRVLDGRTWNEFPRQLAERLAKTAADPRR
jgi:protein gp37